ncbi:hypothetical protein A8F94_22785 [Bacillus sp. FJAT-27225]|uniref:DUF2268 domain-containing protein n=1 Tax=Bacillus sp. FJAT-27225 TaxID=1743144 RepID=UPI00080C2744|nr:DUF2268 domain-containing putative Zn-dependent protease [Bacillus sp. FJAT-27225]OCA81686.1 hypothetical protein A8F94_22785 [Bacillus sp. FJAT-27225]
MLNIYRHLFLILLIISSFLTGCVKDRASTTITPPKKEISTSRNVDNTEGYTIKNAFPTQFNIGEQEFEIVPVFNPLLDYIGKVKEDSNANHKDLYISTVVEPFRKEAFGENGGLGLKDKYNFAAPLNVNRLNESIRLLDEEYENFIRLITEGLEKSSLLLKGEKTTIYLFPANPDQYAIISQMSGVLAFATTNQVIVLHIAPQNFEEDILKYTLAHEYHHTVYLTKKKQQERDLFDYVITEGKADSFANLVFPEINAPWTDELSPEEKQAIWNWAKERRYSFNTNDLAEMNRGNRIIPKWSDYRIGYGMMQDFLKQNPAYPISEWTFMNADEILEKGHFAKKFE